MTEKLSVQQGAIISAYTGILVGRFTDMHEYVEKIMGRPVWTHEMGSQKIADEIKVAAKDDFMALMPEGTFE